MLSLRLVPSDGKTPALLFAVLTSPDAATLTVNSASLGSRPVLGSFAGHGLPWRTRSPLVRFRGGSTSPRPLAAFRVRDRYQL